MIRNRKFYFIIGIFSFVSLNVFSYGLGNNEGTAVNTMVLEKEEEKNRVCKQDSLIISSKTSPFLKAKAGNEENIKPNVVEDKDISLLSFNFIYYAIYKFMYIEDIFELNEPAERGQIKNRY